VCVPSPCTCPGGLFGVTGRCTGFDVRFERVVNSDTGLRARVCTSFLLTVIEPRPPFCLECPTIPQHEAPCNNGARNVLTLFLLTESDLPCSRPPLYPGQNVQHPRLLAASFVSFCQKVLKCHWSDPAVTLSEGGPFSELTILN